jgi:hypothetical protein
MPIHIAGGNIAGVPAFGAVASLSTAEAGQLLAATAGLVRSLAITGGVGLGLGAILIAALDSERHPKEIPNFPLGMSIVQVETHLRHIYGVFLSDAVTFACEGQRFQAPLDRIRWLSGHRFGHSVRLIDGSRFVGVNYEGELRLMTALGPQTVDFKTLVAASPLGTDDLRAMRQRLTVALSQNWDTIAQALGPDIFYRFFAPKALQANNP